MGWMKKLAFFLLGLLLLGAADCEAAEAELLHPWAEYHQRLIEEQGTGRELVHQEYYETHLTEAEAAKYPRLAAALARGNAAITKTAAKDLQKYEQDAREALRERLEYAEDGNIWWGRFEDSSCPYVFRADSRCLSLCTYDYNYFGGVHGMYGYRFVNYDPVTGQQYRLSDIVRDKEAVADAILAKLAANYPRQTFNLTREKLLADYLSGDEPHLNWGLGYYGLTIVFNPYEIASYAEGVQVVTLGFKECRRMLNAEPFVETPPAFVQFQPDYLPGYVDMTGNGRLASLSAQSYSEEKGVGGLLLSVAGVEHRYPLLPEALERTSKLDGYLCRSADGSLRLCLLGAETEADTRACFTFRLDGMLAPVYEGESRHAESGERIWLYSDPEQF